MNRIQLAPGAHLCTIKAQQFHCCRISIHFIWPARRETATAEALLPLLMERCYADCPDMTLLSKKMAKLYGAEMSVSTGMLGGNRILTVHVSGIKDEFALQGEHLSEEYANIALGVAFSPYLVNGEFDAQIIAIEKEQLREAILGEINEKRSYCVRQARRKFFGDTPAGIERLGYLEELEHVTAKQITDAFYHMVQTAQIEVMVLGAQQTAVQQSLQQTLQKIDRKPNAMRDFVAMPPQEVQDTQQPMATAQGKLCLLFTAGQIFPPKDNAAIRVAVALLGGTATSRLFLNVREKKSLCYYCAASYLSGSAVLTIDSGVEHQNANATKQAILEELELLRTGEITDKELDDTKRSLKNQLVAIDDSLGAQGNWYFNEIVRGTDTTPQQACEEIDLVTKEDVRAILKYFTLSVSYTLTKGDSANA